MDSSKLKSQLSQLCGHTGELMAALICLQPLLDVLSYFMIDLAATHITTALRTVMLFVVCAYGFAVSSRKRVHLIAYGLLAAYWLFHALNCLRIGYKDPLSDVGEYLKLVQLPLWTLAFISFFRAKPKLDASVTALLTLNFLLVMLIIALSYLTGRPEYTYSGIKIGLLGWFAVPTAQSAIVSMLCLGLLLWAYLTQKLWVFTAASLFGFGLLYCTATRLTYFSAMLIAAGMLVLIIISAAGKGSGKNHGWASTWLFILPLIATLAVFVALRGVSPMTQRREAANDSYLRYQRSTDRIMGDDKDYLFSGGQVPDEIYEKILRVYQQVYGEPDQHGQPLLGDLLDRFGPQRVIEAYNYSIDAKVLYHTRTRKLMMLELTWEDQDMLTHLLGFEYGNAIVGDNIYDPENDFPALLYYYGWLGAGLYCCFAAYFILTVIFGTLKNLRRLSDFLTVELGVYTMILVLGLGAAQFSGNVMRRPSVTVYMSLAAAEIYCLTHSGGGKLTARFRRRPGVTMKQL